MADVLVQAILSNLLVSTVLAAVAWVVQHRVRSAALANLLWAMVLVKMVTPPLFSLPIVEVPQVFSFSVQAGDTSIATSQALPTETRFPDVEVRWGETPDVAPGAATRPAVDIRSRIAWLAFSTWIVIGGALFLVSLARISRFHRLLKANSHIDRQLTLSLGGEVARALGLRRCPDILVSGANVPPFVWWLAGRPIVVVPRQAIRQLNEGDLRFVLTHEMAHVKRRDHWFRWFEWLASIVLWWNPITWWARLQLRVSEEMACDELVLEATQSDVHAYASSLLNVAELLTTPAVRPPVVASAINSGGSLEQRLKMMISKNNRKFPAALRTLVVTLACCVLPLGFVSAQEFDAIERRLKEAVEAGELTLEQAKVMMQSLNRSAESRLASDRQLEARKRRFEEVAREIERAVKSGQLSREDAERKLTAIKRDLFGDGDGKPLRFDKASDRELEARKRRFMNVMREMELAVKSGKLTKEEAEKKIVAVKKEMFGEEGERESRLEKSANRELEARKRRFMDFMREIENAVKSGKLTKEEAEEKMIAVKMELFGEADAKAARLEKGVNRELEARKRRFMNFMREIELAVKSGKLSKKEAEKKVVAVKKQMFGEEGERESRLEKSANRELEARKRRFEQIVKQIKSAVDRGELSAKDAEVTLAEVRKTLFEARD